MESETMSVVQAARKLGVDDDTAYAAVKRGEIPVIRIGRLYRVPVAAFNRLLKGAK
jgi:excisionase family DNA binding protein